MKALKEKRISLRSLWRRGLVILSLFALVFASCNTSDDPDESTPGSSGKTLLEIRVKTHPTVQNYEGLPVEIGGIVIEARYAGANQYDWVTVSDKDLSSFRVSPKYTQRIVTSDGKDGTTNTAPYTLYATGADGLVMAGINLKVTNLVRSNNYNSVNSSDNLGTIYDPNDLYGNSNPVGDHIADGLNIVALPGTYKDKYYVDDFPDFTGIKVYGQYRNGDFKEIKLDEDIRWEIRPDYTNAGKDDPTGPGVLAITIGGRTNSELWGSDNYNQGYAPAWENGNEGVTVYAKLSEVYHVTGIELAEPLNFNDGTNGIFYWENDAATSWLSLDGRSGRLVDAKLTVTYSNKESKAKSMLDAVRMNTVWYNQNPSLNVRPLTVRGIEDTVKSIQSATTTWPNHKKPQVTIYYRGLTVPCDVYIYSKFSALSAMPIEGVTLPIEVDVSGQDNDKIGNNEKWLADRIKVVATFTAYTDAQKTRDLPLSYQQTYWDTDVDTTTTAAGDGKPLKNGPGNTGLYNYNKWAGQPAYNSTSGTVTFDGGTYYGNRSHLYNVTGDVNAWVGSANNTWRGGPNVYTMNFGDPDLWWNASLKRYETNNDYNNVDPDERGKAWGVSSTPRNNGKTVKVTITYRPGIGTDLYQDTSYDVASVGGFTAGLGPNVKRATVDVLWKNIPPLRVTE